MIAVTVVFVADPAQRHHRRARRRPDAGRHGDADRVREPGNQPVGCLVRSAVREPGKQPGCFVRGAVRERGAVRRPVCAGERFSRTVLIALRRP